MPLRPLSQSSFFDPEFVCPRCLEEGSVPWLLARKRSELFPRWLLTGWRGGGAGRNAWPAKVLATLVLLRWSEEGMSRRASVRRAATDMSWRAAMGLALDGIVPSERTLRDFERFLRARHAKADVPRYLLLHEHVVRLCRGKGVVGDDAVWATDSTPMWCYGAVLDTVRLLGDGLRLLGRGWAKATRTCLGEIATAWQLPLLVAKSTKGALAIDWHDRDARAEALARLAHDTLRVVGLVRSQLAQARASMRKSLLKLCAHLLRVVSNDFDSDEQGRLVIARRVSRGRLVSLTDPEARHGRKSRSRTFNGFKLHILGDVVSGVIASVGVTPGNAHDGSVAERLIRRAKALFEDIECLLADTAYGGAALRHAVSHVHQVRLLAPPPPANFEPPEGRFARADFDIVGDAVTCPNGVASTTYTTVHARAGMARRYVWQRQECDACPARARCLDKNYRRGRLLLHAYEPELREARVEWSRPETREAYRQRSQCERLVNQMTRHGARRARSWGLAAAHFQAHAIATTCNLALLARALADGSVVAA